MRQARDTFLRFLSDNLPGIAVHNLRKDTNFPDTSVLQMNAVNVQFLTDYPKVCVSTLTATVDVVSDNELPGIDMATSVFLLMTASGLTPILDYSDPTNPPVPLGSNLFWNPESIKFRPVYGDTYFRHSALITLYYHIYQAYTAP